RRIPRDDLASLLADGGRRTKAAGSRRVARPDNRSCVCVPKPSGRPAPEGDRRTRRGLGPGPELRDKGDREMSNQIRSTCSEVERLRGLLEGTLPEAEQAELESHIEGCETCRRTFDLVAAESRFWDDVRRFAAPGDETTRHPGEPENEEEPIGFLEADD